MYRSFVIVLLVLNPALLHAQDPVPKFNVTSFFKAQHDKAHISFVREAHGWFSEWSKQYQFGYDSTDNWENLNLQFLSNYQVVIFLDARPEAADQRIAFEKFLKNGGAWLGFHFSGFSLTPSAFPQNWDWYHNEFLGAGEYKGNTWRPTAAVLKVEHHTHPVTKNLPEVFISAPNEWYAWQNDLRKHPDIDILVSIDPVSFPLGTGPKPHEIWYEGDYPVVWTNRKYRMVYINMGHNDIDYENKTDRELSRSFTTDVQNLLILNTLLWLGSKLSEF